MSIIINGVEWFVYFIDPNDKRLLMDGEYTIGVTDLLKHTVCISNGLSEVMKYRCIVHEVSHCLLYSYGFDLDIPEEEYLCQFMEEYSDDVIELADTIYMEF